MNIVISDKDSRDVICAYKNCISIPQKYNTIVIGDDVYMVAYDPCFSYEKNTVWLFVEKL